MTNIRMAEGVEVFPTIEIIDGIYAPPGQEGRFAIPVDITEDDLRLAADGKFVTRVIYLEDPQHALPAQDPKIAKLVRDQAGPRPAGSGRRTWAARRHSCAWEPGCRCKAKCWMRASSSDRRLSWPIHRKKPRPQKRTSLKPKHPRRISPKKKAPKENPFQDEVPKANQPQKKAPKENPFQDEVSKGNVLREEVPKADNSQDESPKVNTLREVAPKVIILPPPPEMSNERRAGT